MAGRTRRAGVGDRARATLDHQWLPGSGKKGEHFVRLERHGDSLGLASSPSL